MHHGITTATQRQAVWGLHGCRWIRKPLDITRSQRCDPIDDNLLAEKSLDLNIIKHFGILISTKSLGALSKSFLNVKMKFIMKTACQPHDVVRNSKADYGQANFRRSTRPQKTRMESFSAAFANGPSHAVRFPF